MMERFPYICRQDITQWSRTVPLCFVLDAENGYKAELQKTPP